ncbi:MAG: hypothetical protein GYA55_09035 [SAR324 cluster bacterium]|uniref:DUF6754 domain-containing protein n=1 Tax=SAR324 cluster bacterium TaxID=2024889 RepID=A0A7X9IJN8_9DELT|nr:hypothetical protein [SAR324 cluster bacterium]
MRKARRGEKIYVRRISGVDAIDEAIGRAAELGRPISFTTGLTGVSPVLYAALGVLFYVSRKAALFASRLFAPQSAPDVMAITEDVMRDAYRNVGKLSNFDPQQIIFLSEDQLAFASGYIGLLHRERVASAFLFGSFAGEALILAEAGQQIGAMQVAATVTPEQVAFFIAACDYTLIGEELFAASAYLSQEPVQLGSLVGQDIGKLLFFTMIVIGVLISTFNSVFPDLALNNIGELISGGTWIYDKFLEFVL